ncbi:MAG: hypothetical protein AAGI01_04310 [Myxococcota bacterium]
MSEERDEMMNTSKTAVVIAAALWIVGCDSEPKQPGAAQTAEAEEEVSPESEAATRARKTAFGLPLPPRVTQFSQFGEDSAFVLTDMDTPQLEEFYRRNLVDYEVIRNGPQLRAVGLRTTMPEIRGRHLGGPRSYVRLEYRPQRVVPQREESAGRDAESGEPGDARPKDASRAKRFIGSPVLLRLPSGELLAPGAKWGEPYMPEPGTPLHKEEYKSNWGRPFGEWKPG